MAITLIPSATAIPLQSQLTGRLRNITKPRGWFMAVAEAIKNAIDSLDERGVPGEIIVDVVREKDLFTNGALSRVKDVIVRDTGSGFTSANFDSFRTPDSTLKINRGGKGLGRLICLQTFSRIEVSSTFVEEGKKYHREFIFKHRHPTVFWER